MKNMLDGTILIVGYGSVGRRHLQNLQSLGHNNFVLLRSGKSTLPSDDIRDIPTVSDLVSALTHKPIATIIANPTALHMPIALAAAKAGSHIFLEKPISDSLEGADELRRLARQKRIIIQVGFQYRFNPGLVKVKQLLSQDKIGRVVAVQAHWGQYLPDWHPWEDYHQSYSAKAKLGGGVLLTLCHPFDYLRWLFGDVSGVSAQVSSGGALGIDVEDAADVLLQFKGGLLGNVHLNYLEKEQSHYMRIVGKSGVICWDNILNEVKWQVAKSSKWQQYKAPVGFERNKMFRDEMKHFISCIIGNEQTLCTLDDGVEALKIVLAAKRSSVSKKVEIML